MIVKDIVGELENILGNRSENIVIYSALWPLLRLTNSPAQQIVADLCAEILNLFSDCTILMPTFTSGFDKNGICDLDLAQSQTGAISEHFRCLPGVQRTLSAFFSFAVHGPNAASLISLKPQEAWGVGSLYEWLYNQDATIVTLGLHPTHCSYTHYAEWVNRKRIQYRFNKSFAGTLIRDKASIPTNETLFVRKRDPEPVNDFTHLLTVYLANGMRVSKPHGYPISCISAKRKIDAVNEEIKTNALALLANKEQFSNYEK